MPIQALKPILGEAIGLQTPRGRLFFFGCATGAIMCVPYSWLTHLSLWQALHIPAPSIGLTRAYWLLIHGHPTAAWHRNRYIYLVLAIGLTLLAIDLLRILQERHKRSGNAPE